MNNLEMVIENYSLAEDYHSSKSDKLNEEGFAPIHLAVINKDTRLLEEILLVTENINIKDKNGNTALHLAAHDDNYDFIEMLLTYGADMTIKDRKNRTAAYIAGQKNHHGIYELIANWDE